MSAQRDEEMVLAYEKLVGRPPVTRYPDDPDWRYRGTKTEREALLERLEQADEPTFIEGQEELF